MVAPAARGRGLATAALRCSRAGRSRARRRPLQLTTHLDNAASQRVAEQVGIPARGRAALVGGAARPPRRPRDVLAPAGRPVSAPIGSRALLHDGRAGLRPWREDDVAAILAMSRDPETIRFTSVPDPYDEDSVRIWLALQPARLRAGDGAAFAVVEPPGEEALGAIGVRVLHGRGIAEIGYHMAPEARGRGLATAALRLLSDWSFRDAPGRAAAADDARRQPRLAAGGREGRLHPRGRAALVGRPARGAGRPDHVLAAPR